MLIFFFTGGGAGAVASVAGVAATGQVGIAEVSTAFNINARALPTGVQAVGYVGNLIVWAQDTMSRPGADIWAPEEVDAPLPQPWKQIRPSATEIWKEIVPEDLW